jgi:electron transport complex protein RnfD
MLDVLIALLPATIAGIVIFGLEALLVVAVCVAACVGFEYLFNLIAKKEQTIGDYSAAVTGLLLGLNLPATTPIWQCVIGALFAIVVVKCLFGGLGYNFVNPAITARVFMLVCSFASVAAFPVDVKAGSTPLVDLANGKNVELLDLLLGKHGGAIGETCAVALILGFLYLLARGVISWEIPVSFIGSVFVFSFLMEGDAMKALAAILSGGLLLGAIFMATDYVTTPITRSGKMLFCVGAGIITVLIRFYGSYPEGVSFSILLMNILSPYIEKWTAPHALGGKKA